MPIRKRKQIIINYRSEQEPYYVAIRVITFNPNVTLKMLILIAMRERRRLEINFKGQLNEMTREMGTEDEDVDTSEDRNLNNKDIYVHGILGFIYGDNKEYDKAEKLFYKGLEISPNNPLLYLALGQMFDRRKEYNTAIDYYERILEFTEDEVERDFEHMNQYYHKFMEFYPDSLAKAKEEARKCLKKDYKKTRRETIL